MINSKTNVVILAAGKGTRMCSDIPKVLHLLAGKPIIQYVIDTAKELNVKKIHLIYGHGGDLLKKTLQKNNLNWILQAKQLGTGHAIQQASSFFDDNEDVLILYGDVPLISVETLIRLQNSKPYGGIGLLTAKLNNPSDYGRIIRKNGKVTSIIEYKDATDKQRRIQEINTGILITGGTDIKRWLSKLTNINSQNEFHITDIIALASQEGRKITTIHPKCSSEVEGINSIMQLSRLERIYQNEQAKKLMLSGVILHDPLRFDLRGTFKYGRDVNIDANVILEGNVVLGSRVKIGFGCIIKNSIINDDCEIKPYSVLENTILHTACIVGPFAHLRPGTELLRGSSIGNFVETKKIQLGQNSKAGHLSYLGDAEIGNNVNIGAGTITCNYNGINKFKTLIGDNVFIGSDSQLIAPINIGKGATIAAGTTVTRDVADNELVLSRVPQINKQGWQMSSKEKNNSTQ